MNNRLPPEFFRRDVLTVAPELLGKRLVRKYNNDEEIRYVITEAEAYIAPHDKACHASKGRTPRTEVMFKDGGLVYVYLIYGLFWMLNIVTGREGEASAVLIRGVQDTSGPGRVGRLLQLDKSFYGENLYTSNRLWIEDAATSPKYKSLPRVGIDYAGEPWISMPWRYLAEM